MPCFNNNKKQNVTNNDYFIHNIKLSKIKEAKYLGVTIDHQLHWKPHINNICGKANKTLAFLKRHLSGCSQKIKAKSYEIYVRPTLEYSSNAWDPYHQNAIDQIEKVQRRAARWACNIYDREKSVTKIINERLKWDTLEERRAKSKVTLLYKARNKLCHIPTNDLIQKNYRSTRKSNNGCGYVVPGSRTDAHIFSFYPSAIRLWNNLPAKAQTSNSLEAFKNNVSNIKVGIPKKPTYSKLQSES